MINIFLLLLIRSWCMQCHLANIGYETDNSSVTHSHHRRYNPSTFFTNKSHSGGPIMQPLDLSAFVDMSSRTLVHSTNNSLMTWSPVVKLSELSQTLLYYLWVFASYSLICRCNEVLSLVVRLINFDFFLCHCSNHGYSVVTNSGFGAALQLWFTLCA